MGLVEVITHKTIRNSKAGTRLEVLFLQTRLHVLETLMEAPWCWLYFYLTNQLSASRVKLHTLAPIIISTIITCAPNPVLTRNVREWLIFLCYQHWCLKQLCVIAHSLPIIWRIKYSNVKSPTNNQTALIN